jgi:site-specific DNA recombinase
MASRSSVLRRRGYMGVKEKRRDGRVAFTPRIDIRCAIYTRKSTDEGLDQSFNTLDAQREAAELFINSQRHEGWAVLPQKYDDGGYSGANMDRPALKRLLADVENGVVNCVVVYKVDRLSRSLLDFARIMEVLDKYGATFVSVTQQFNTTSSMGRLTLNILLSFAQFEREMISERTKDKMSAARRKGKWVGGNLVLGYDVAPKGGALLVNQEEAKRIKTIFAMYLEFGSLMPVVEELDRRGWRMKSWTTRDGRQVGGKPIAKNNLYNLLTNMIYLGKIDYEGHIYKGEHERIIDDDAWNKVQTTLNRNGRRGGRTLRNKYGALLKGLLQCASCNVGMTHTYVNKKDRLYRYYVCVKAHQRGWAQCETRSVSAPALENAVIEQLRGIASNPQMTQKILLQLSADRQKESVEREREKADIENELRHLADEMKEAVSSAGKAASVDVTSNRLVLLQDRVSHLSGRLAGITQELAGTQEECVDLHDLETALGDFDALWEQLSTGEQERFIRTLVESVRFDGKSRKVTMGFRSSGIKDFCNWAPALKEKYANAR